MASVFDKVIAALAAKQYGYVTRAQLLAIGLGPAAIVYRVRTGRLIPVHAGVYAVGHVNRTPVARAMAAILACGENAVLSHGSAASLWGFDKYWHMPYEVTVPALRNRKGITVHRSRTLARRDITWQLGVHVTTPERTILDIAPRLTDRRLTRVVNDGRHAGYIHLDSLAEVLNRNPKHPGAKRVWPLVHANRPPTRSELEDDFEAFRLKYGLPAPTRTNTYLFGHEVDVLYATERVIVEIDGYLFHSDRDSFERDRDRDAERLAAGFVTVRLTRKRMKQQAEREARRLNAILMARRRHAA
jgi:hypothetical protein